MHTCLGNHIPLLKPSERDCKQSFTLFTHVNNIIRKGVLKEHVS